MSLFSRMFRRSGSSSGGASVIAAGATLTGTVRGAGHLVIEGVLDGDLSAGTVLVAPGGLVRGEISADLLHVAGTVRGTAQVGTLRMDDCGRFSGDALYENLDVAPGATFDARCRAMPARAVGTAKAAAPRRVPDKAPVPVKGPTIAVGGA